MMWGITHTLPWWVAMALSFAAAIRWEARRERCARPRGARRTQATSETGGRRCTTA